MASPADVDAYIAATPIEVRAMLEQLRDTIKRGVPAATERISYGMPYYEYNGRLVYFRLAKRHIGVYIPSPIIDEHKDALKDYDAHQATIRLPLDQELPVALIETLVKARARKNDEGRMGQ
ncbi:MAG TPA: DUF1801 domain-containing protein [Nitrolancea sp.]|jgi:uncharacterized protein YdhG (YjbR/CyaY superfamily)|nr:DUF1801 domain-containing protein [Nitrolancea sp.]